MPELEALFGVPQPARSHPEIDAGLHSLMVLEQAALLTPEPQVRFGALVHDLGKGLTPASEWPRHKGHEQRGVPLVDRLCRRLGAPASYRRIGMRAAGGHGLAHKAAELKPGTLLDLLQEWGALAEPAGVERLIVVGWADKRGRTGFESVGYPAAAVLRQARAVVAAEPVEPRRTLRQRRLLALARLRSEMAQDPVLLRP
jgi:tRNA nucleotidyltransferase (CCA-adding enzyme)